MCLVVADALFDVWSCGVGKHHHREAGLCWPHMSIRRKSSRWGSSIVQFDLISHGAIYEALDVRWPDLCRIALHCRTPIIVE